MKGRPMRGKKFGTVTGGFMMAGVSGYMARAIWFGTEEDFLLQAPVTEEGYILPSNYVKVYENFGPGLTVDMDNGVDDLVRLTSRDVLGQKYERQIWGTWRIYRGGPRGLWITFEEPEGPPDYIEEQEAEE